MPISAHDLILQFLAQEPQAQPVGDVVPFPMQRPEGWGFPQQSWLQALDQMARNPNSNIRPFPGPPAMGLRNPNNPFIR